MKATVDIHKRSVLAEQPIVDGLEARFNRGRETGDRRARPLRAVIVAVSVVAVSAASFVWATLGDSGAQLVESDVASPTTTLPPAHPDGASAPNGVDRAALVVDVDRLDLEPGTDPEPTTAPETTAGGTTDPTIDKKSGPAAEPPISATARATRAPDGALQAAGASSTTTGSSGGSSLEPSSTAPNRSTGSEPTSTSTSTSIFGSTSTKSESGIAWEEHFNSLDTDRWQVEHSTYGDGNGERQCYQPDNVRVTNGRLVLTARAETATCPNGSTRTVTSGMVRSRGLTFSPGQTIEFRVKLTPPDPSNQAGLWPAVWASSWAGSWPRGGELDFLEVMTAEDPRRAVFSMHYADRSGRHELQNRGVPLAGYFSNGWHTIRFVYGRNGNLAWYLDGSEVFSVSAAETAQGYPAPFDQTIHEIKVNLAVGGSPGPLASGALGSTGATFEIDYIRVSDL